MDLPTQETLQQLLTRLMNPELSAETHQATAELIRARFPIEESAEAYAQVARHALAPEAAVSFTLRILYVHGRKRPDERIPKETFGAVMGDRSRTLKLRTQAFLHLLLLDIDMAERAVHAVMPEMAALVAVERSYPTIRRADDGEDAPYEEALVNLLFH